MSSRGMNMLVCVKQVPDTTEIKIDPVTNTLVRTGVPSILNPFDGYALELAARLKDGNGGKIVVITMGPDQAKAVLKECLSVCADKVYLLSDSVFGGSDTLATSYILSRAIRALEEKEGSFDIIFCGKQAIDGDTAQVGPEIAEHLGYPQITYAVEAYVEEKRIKVKREVDEGYEIAATILPCVITVTKTFDLRYPNLKLKMAANRAGIPVLSSKDIDLDLNKTGLKGSPTKVKKIFTPAVNTGGVLKIDGSDAESAADKLLSLIEPLIA